VGFEYCWKLFYFTVMLEGFLSLSAFKALSTSSQSQLSVSLISSFCFDKNLLNYFSSLTGESNSYFLEKYVVNSNIPSIDFLPSELGAVFISDAVGVVFLDGFLSERFIVPYPF
jgi:hypothetical protein